MELLGRLQDALRGGLDSVIAGALAGGAPEPSWVAADDGSGAWVAEVAGRSGAERARFRGRQLPLHRENPVHDP